MSEADCTVEFRDVPGFPGYRVGSDGSVWSCWRNGGDDRTGQQLTKSWHQLNGWIDKRRGQQTGYVKMGLMREGKLRHLKLHRLVLDVFVGPCPEGLQGRHIDDDKSNNRRENLIWGTPSQNGHDRYTNGLMPIGESHHRAVLKATDVVEVRLLLAEKISERKIASRFGVSKGTIAAIKNGKSWKHVIELKGVQS